MIFGYPNGTDSIIDISDYLYFGENLYNDLYGNFTIENNIFDFEPSNIIKIVSIPYELIIKINNGDIEGELIKNNSEWNGLEPYRIEQNTNIIKTSKYYYIDYQYIVIETQYELKNKKRLDSEGAKYYYGRINRLKFKLCHEFCESCYELGSSESQQKCSSCLPEFQYNYLAFINNNHEENEINCAPEEYFFDRDNKLTKCDVSNSKFYNTEDNKKICFDKSKDCPGDLHLNEQTGECFNCDLAHYNRGKCTKEEVKAESCTYPM